MCCCRSGRRSSVSAMPRSALCARCSPARWRACRCRPGCSPSGSAARSCSGSARRWSASGFCWPGSAPAMRMLAAALVLAGTGAAVQHPIAAHLVAQAFSGTRSRTALASYNFSGDLGKMAFPALTAGLVALMPWQSATLLLGVFALAAAAVILSVRGLPGRDSPPVVAAEKTRRDRTACRERARVSAAAVDRDDRQRDADGVSDLSAVSAEAEGRRPADDRHRVDPDLYRRRRRQAGLRLARRAARGAQGGVPDRGSDRRRHRRAAAAAAVRGARSSCR